jgi:hypothetical protein
VINLDTVVIVLAAVLSTALAVVFIVGSRATRFYFTWGVAALLGTVALVFDYTAYRRITSLPIHTMPPGTATAGAVVFGLLDLVWGVVLVLAIRLFWFDPEMDAFVAALPKTTPEVN